MGQIVSVVRRSLKRKREPESDDQNQARKVLAVEGPNKEEKAVEVTTAEVDADASLVEGSPQENMVTEEELRCLKNMSVLITTYEGTLNHLLPVGAITAMASKASAASFMLLGSSNPLSEGTSSFTQASLPYHGCHMIDPSSHPSNIRSIIPNNPSNGIVLDLTSNSYDPPQFSMDKPPARDQDQNGACKILVIEDPNKDGTIFATPHTRIK